MILNALISTAIATAESPRIGSGVSAATTAIGLYIPGDIGEIGVAVGIISTSIILYVQLKKSWSNDKLDKLEYKKREIEFYLLRQEKEKRDKELLKDGS